MVDYVPLVKRFRGACRCPVCSSNPEIVQFYVNDFVCKFDSFLCDRFFGGVVHCLGCSRVSLVKRAVLVSSEVVS